MAMKVAPNTVSARVVNTLSAPSADMAEGEQIQGKAQGAYVIGAALVYPHHAPGSELTAIENCLGAGVKEPKA